MTQDNLAVAPDRSLALTTTETATLRQCERIIAKHANAFREAARALLIIRTQRLYRDVAPTFEAYCQGTWGFTASRARQLVDAGRVIDSVSKLLPAVTPPQTERQARALVGLADTDAAAAWRDATEICGSVPGGGIVEREAAKFRTDAPRAAKVVMCEYCETLAATRTVKICDECAQ